MAAVVEAVLPPLKKASAAKGATAGPPELIWNAGALLTALTTSMTMAECVRLPLMPVMVNVKLPTGVVLEVETLNVEEPEPVSEAGLNVPVAPLGKPLTLNATFPAKP